jgi:hypothetical protein
MTEDKRFVLFVALRKYLPNFRLQEVFRNKDLKDATNPLSIEWLLKAVYEIGIVNQKVLPFPNSLSTPIFPPCLFIICAEI